MTTNIEINIPDSKNPPALKFPNQCINCGKPREAVMPLTMNMGVEKRRKPVMLELDLPMCGTCMKKEQSITKVTLVPFLVSGLIIGVIAFVPAWLVAPQGMTPQTLDFDLILGGLAGLVAGVIGGTLVEFLLKFAFVPVYGQLLLKRPLTAFSMFNDSEDVIGFSARFKNGRKSVNLIFENDVIAREFGRMNRS